MNPTDAELKSMAQAAIDAGMAYRDDLLWALSISAAKPDFGTQAYDAEKMAAFESQLTLDVASSAEGLVRAGIITRESIQSLQGKPYATGPAAGGGYGLLLLVALANVQGIVDSAAAWIEVGKFAVEIVRKRKRGTPRYQTASPISLSMPLLIGLCLQHAANAYPLKGEVEIDIYPRSNAFGYADSSHPSGSESYLFRIKSKQTAYCYVVTGVAEVLEHFQIKRGKITLLPMPDFFDTDAYALRAADGHQHILLTVH